MSQPSFFFYSDIWPKLLGCSFPNFLITSLRRMGIFVVEIGPCSGQSRAKKGKSAF